MTIFLVRHAKSEKRVTWDGPDPLRPLAPMGVRQAAALARWLTPEKPQRLVSSPHLRCRQTLEPLARRTGLRIETDERLSEGERPAKALALLRELEGQCAVVCSHNAIVSAFVAEWAERGARVQEPNRCEKGGVWRLDPERAHYTPPPVRYDEPDEPERQRIGVVDLGSTSFHLLVADVTPAGRIWPVSSERAMLRLGALVAGGAEIPADACERAVEAARVLRQHALQAGAKRLLPVGTAALRQAANGAALAERLGEALGAPVRIVDGAEEARLIFGAFRRRVLLPPGVCLGADLGGGSLELALGDDAGVDWETTLPLGVARLHGELVGRDPMRKREVRRVRERVGEALAPHREAIRSREPSSCIATGGTARALGRLLVARRGLRPSATVNQLAIGADELRALADDLVRSSHAERLAMPGMRKPRADLMPTGALVLHELARQLGLEGYTLSDWGLREGVLLDAVVA